MKNLAHIEDWQELPVFPTGSCLVGRVMDHPRQEQFCTDTQQTSRLVRIDRENGFAETANTLYTLGKEIKSNDE